MSGDEHDEIHEWAGAYALGALEPADRRRFERHLHDCERCAAELRAFVPIPGLLGQVDFADLDVAVNPETAAAISEQVRHEVRHLRTSRNRWRSIALAAAALVVVAVAAAVATRGGDEADDRAQAAAVTSSLAAETSVATTTRGWGTQIDLDLSGLPQRDRYQLWAVDVSGTWSVAASWGPTDTGRARVTGASSTPTDQLRRLVVTSDDVDDVIVDAEA